MLADKSVKMTLVTWKELDSDKKERRIGKIWGLFLAGLGYILQRYLRKISAVEMEYLECLEE